jgi:hypothetical protein
MRHGRPAEIRCQGHLHTPLRVLIMILTSGMDLPLGELWLDRSDESCLAVWGYTVSRE